MAKGKKKAAFPTRPHPLAERDTTTLSAAYPREFMSMNGYYVELADKVLRESDSATVKPKKK